jgi:hypothetical protein
LVICLGRSDFYGYIGCGSDLEFDFVVVFRFVDGASWLRGHGSLSGCVGRHDDIVSVAHAVPVMRRGAVPA